MATSTDILLVARDRTESILLAALHWRLILAGLLNK